MMLENQKSKRGKLANVLRIESKIIIGSLFGMTLFTIGTAAFYSYRLHNSFNHSTELQERRTKSIVLADELRQSSDDLTNFARMYAITEDPKYKLIYNRIIDIRNGMVTRPPGYQEVYWDLAVVNTNGINLFTVVVDENGNELGEKIPFEKLMENLGMDREELALMQESKMRSDSLASIEMEVFKIIESAEDWRTKSNVRKRLFDVKYLSTKAKIMEPIKKFYVHVDERTQNDLLKEAKKSKQYITIIAILTVLTLVLVSLLRFAIYISQRKNRNLLSSLNANNTAINKSNAVIEFCPNGFIMDANKNFLEIMGYDFSEIEGKHHSIFISSKEKKSKDYKGFWKDLANGKFKSGDFTRYKKDGSVAYIHGTYNPISDDKRVIKVLKIVTDISESVLQKQELDRKNSYLEHAAKILRHDMHSGINTYIPRGIKSLERRMEKIISGDTQIQKQIEAPMKLLKEGLAHAQKVYAGVKEFTNLVKKDACLEKEEYDIAKSLRDFLKSTSYNSQVQIQDMGNVAINEPLFCTAVDNLIRNGLRYNDNATKYVKIYKEGNMIIVEDNGRGMTQEEFEELSKPYTRKEGNKETGSGLGLNICVAIMREHGFKVSCEKIKSGTIIKIKID